MISLRDHGNVICCKGRQTSFYAHNVTEGIEKKLYPRVFMTGLSNEIAHVCHAYLDVPIINVTHACHACDT